MEINIGMDGDIVIVDITGDLVASTAEDFKGQILKLTEKNFNYILVDMSKINFMDSSGLGTCMAIHKLLNGKEGQLVCAKPNEAIAKVFRITRADQKLNIAATKNDGIKYLHTKLIEKRQK